MAVLLKTKEKINIIHWDTNNFETDRGVIPITSVILDEKEVIVFLLDVYCSKIFEKYILTKEYRFKRKKK